MSFTEEEMERGDWERDEMLDRRMEDERKRTSTAPAAIADKSGQEALAEAMQGVWNAHAEDSGCFPSCFEWRGGYGTLFADFEGSHFVNSIVDVLKSRGFSIVRTPPSARPRGESDGPGCPVSAMRPAERPTPITDAADRFAPGETAYEHSVRRSVAMADLERQLAKAQAGRDECERQFQAKVEELIGVMEQRDRLAEAGGRLMSAIEANPTSHKPDVRIRLDLACREMHAAIAAVKGTEPNANVL